MAICPAIKIYFLLIGHSFIFLSSLKSNRSAITSDKVTANPDENYMKNQVYLLTEQHFAPKII